jgi:hypothetical protein
MGQDSIFPSCHPKRLIHTSHNPQYPDHKDITWSISWCFFSWFMHKTYVVAMVPVFRALLLALSRNSGVWVHSPIWKVVTLGQTMGLPQPGSRTQLPGEGLRRSSWKECKILNQAPKLLELRPSCAENKHTRGRENFDKAITFDQMGASMCSLQLSKHASTKWLTVSPA